ncbi:PRC-barrel domain-containing protein [Pseudotabrizicola alkalilacus]|uniref:PRC-barrel domain containing protein n=1 Tax=Pseudotabrizicola alkalilacus TaxID=2305252 RepID=A0A411Z335_9RHOB|nr:PRC-barrel domain-containing protein [Pseudotabrizicola alkalilacus]RGP37491.1 PRC-barrel domain containing protein [Pseudotabrizicola alkalilacus]
MDHSKHTAIPSHELNEALLANAPIYGADDEKVGTVSHVHGQGPTMHVVLDVGGFLGIGSKQVLVSVDQLNLMRDENGKVHGTTPWTKDQLKDLPEHTD